MELHSTVFHGIHIFLYQSQIFHIKKFWHALSVHIYTYESPGRARWEAILLKFVSNLKKLDRYIYKKKYSKIPMFFVSCRQE
jgi:hypothetical protein